MRAPSFAFPQPLAERYRPKAIAEFIGLEKQKRILANFAHNPRNAAFLFTGPSGTGKTTMALALCDAIAGELIHIPSQHCTVAELEESLRMTQYVPMAGKRFWFVLVDEADQMTDKAQLALLSKLDSTGRIDGCVFAFTCNSTDRLRTFTIADSPIEPGRLESKHILTPEEVAERLKVPVTWIYENTRSRATLRNADPLPNIRMGKYLRFYWPEIEKWLERHQGGQANA